MDNKITYLVANFNNGKYIQDCINSLHAQTCPDWYCIIADDGSTDNSLVIIRSLLCEKVKLLENPKNIGYIETLELLMEHSKTDIVGILDPDDALFSMATELVLKAYQTHPETGFVYTNYDYYDSQLVTKIRDGISSPIPQWGSALYGGYVGALRTYRMEDYRKTQGLDPNILYAEDRDLIYKMEEVTSFIFVDHVLYQHRYLPTSQSNDTKKNKIGIKNHKTAYYKALKRRQIAGIRKWAHLLYINTYDFSEIWSSKFGRILKVLFNPIIQRIIWFIIRFKR